jgi:hypothetical protein
LGESRGRKENTVTNIEELLTQVAELKATVEQIADEQKVRLDGPPFKILEVCDRPVEFDPEAAGDGAVLLVRGAEYMCAGGRWINYAGETYTHSEMTQKIQNVLTAEADVTLLHRGY